MKYCGGCIGYDENYSSVILLSVAVLNYSQISVVVKVKRSREVGAKTF